MFLFLNISSHACCELLPAPTRSTALMLLPFQQVHGMKGAWHVSGEETPALWSCPPWAGHCWQAGCSQRSGVSACSCPPVSSSAWPWGWVAGRSLQRGHGSVLFAPFVLPKAWCWSADRKAISQLRVIGAPFSNWGASTHLQSLLKSWLCCRVGVSSTLFLLLFMFYYFWMVLLLIIIQQFFKNCTWNTIIT